MPAITDPNEPYFKDGIWAWAATLWQRLISEGGRLFTALHGWDGAAWHRLPMVWGYSDVYSEQQAIADVPAGAANVAYSAVPAGQIWIVQNFTVYPKQANITRLSLRAHVGGILIYLRARTTNILDDTLEMPHWVVLKEGDFLEYRYEGAAAGDDFYSYASGYKMLIAE